VERTVGRRVWTRVGEGSPRRKTFQRYGLACAAGLGIFRLCCPFSLGVVEGSSMTPTYRPGQIFLLDRHYYQSHPVQRGDVVVVQCDDHTMIKRVFGIAGDSIWLLVQPEGNKVERYIIDPELVPRLRRATRRWDIGRLAHFTVPNGSVYLLGDCTEASIDSRSFGAVPITSVVGRVSPMRQGAGFPTIRRAGASTPTGAVPSPTGRRSPLSPRTPPGPSPG
jgi:signal peptidase I